MKFNIKAKKLFVDWKYVDSFFQYYEIYNQIIQNAKVIILGRTKPQSIKNIEFIIQEPISRYEKVYSYLKYEQFIENIDCIAGKNYCVDNSIVSGDLETIKLLNKNGCIKIYEKTKMDGLSACDLAALYGNFECLQYLHKNGYKLNKGSFYVKPNCKQYYIENITPKVLKYKYLYPIKCMYLVCHYFIN